MHRLSYLCSLAKLRQTYLVASSLSPSDALAESSLSVLAPSAAASSSSGTAVSPTWAAAWVPFSALSLNIALGPLSSALMPSPAGCNACQD